MLPFLVELTASLVGSMGGRALVGQVLKKVAPEALKGISKEFALGAGEIAGITATIGTLQGGKKEDYREALKGAYTGYALGQAVFYPVKYTLKGAGKIAKAVVPKELREKFNPVRLFISHLNDKEKELILKYTQEPQRVYEVGSQMIHSLYKDIFHNNEDFQKFTRSLFSFNETLKNFYEWELTKRASGERLSEIASLEYLLTKPEAPIVKEFQDLRNKVLDMITKNPIYKEKREAFIQVRKKILERLIKENPEREEVIRKLIETPPPEHIIAGYIPRMHVRVPFVKEGATSELDVIDDPYEIFKDIRTISSADMLGALKPREFPTLLARINSALEKGVSPEHISYRSGSNTFRAFLSSFTVPTFMKNFYELVEEIGILKPTTEDIIREKSFVRLLGKNIPRRLNDVLKNIFYTYAGLPPPLQGISLALHRVNMFLKHFTLALSPFHAVVLTKNALAEDPVIASEGIVRGFVNAITGRNLDDIAKNVYEGIKELNARGYSTQFTVGLPEGYDFVIDNMVRGFQKFMIKLGFGKYMPDEYIRGTAKVLSFPTILTWNGFFRAFKLLSADKLIKEWRVGRLTDEELKSGLDAINDVYGGAYFWRFLKPEQTAMLRFFFFAPDWYVSLWKNFQSWVSDKAVSIVDFIPTLARINMYIALSLNSLTDPDGRFFDKVQDAYEKTAYAWRVMWERGERNPLVYYSVLHNYWREIFKIKIPVRASNGHIKMIDVDPLRIELEPMEMVGASQFFESLAKQVKLADKTDMLEALDEAGGGALGYWYNKASSILRMFSKIGTSLAYGREMPLSDIFLRVFADTLPLSLTSGWKAENYMPNPDDEGLLKIMLILRNFSIPSHANELGEYLTPKLLSENPKEVQEAISVIKKAIPLKAVPYIVKGKSNKFHLNRVLDSITTSVINQLYKEFHFEQILTDIAERKIDGEDIKPLMKNLEARYQKAIERIDKSALPQPIKNHLKKKLHDVVIKKYGQILTKPKYAKELVKRFYKRKE